MARDPITHVIIMDGTMSSLRRAMETNAGLTYRLLKDSPDINRMSLNYIEGIQWHSKGGLINVIAGIGINSQIRRAYGYIASRYRPGDRIFLFGFSRGAYAVRSLAGIIDRIGLLQAGHATERNIRVIFRHYQKARLGLPGRKFARHHCHGEVPIEMIGVWDTVKSLGIEYPLLWRLAPQPTDFHDHDLGKSIKNGFHALALDESRSAFKPVMWAAKQGFAGHVEQMWFRGSHSDVGGDIRRFQAARPLSNIPFVWMMEKAESCGLHLPTGWQDQFPMDALAPHHGTLRGIGKFYLFRRKRQSLADPTEQIHASAVKPPAAKQDWSRVMQTLFRRRKTV